MSEKVRTHSVPRVDNTPRVAADQFVAKITADLDLGRNKLNHGHGFALGVLRETL